MNIAAAPLPHTAFLGHVKDGVVVFDDANAVLPEGQEVRIEPVVDGEYRHVPLQLVDMRRVRYAAPVPLEPRRHVFEEIDE